MLLPWKWREVYCAYTMRDKELIFTALESAGIEYDYKVDGSFDPKSVNDRFSGLISHHAAELRIFVRPADYEQALFLVRKALRESGTGEE